MALSAEQDREADAEKAGSFEVVQLYYFEVASALTPKLKARPQLRERHYLDGSSILSLEKQSFLICAVKVIHLMTPMLLNLNTENSQISKYLL